MEKPCVYISLVNWNSTDKTFACIESIQQQTYQDYRIVIVDNASSDNSVQKITTAYPEILFLQARNNGGYATGHEMSVRRALEDEIELLFILNNDTELEPDVLEKLVNAYHIHGSGIYGGVPVTGKGIHPSRVQMHYKFLNPNYREVLFDWDSYKPYEVLFPHPDAIQPVAAINGSCFLLPLAVVRQHGFMDQDFFLYSEEIDYCFRLRNAGVPLWIVPDARIWHEHEGSSKSASILSDIVQYYRIRNQLVRIKRYGSSWDLFRAVLKNALLVLFQLLRGRFRRVGFLLRALWDGLRGKLGKTFAPEHYI